MTRSPLNTMRAFLHRGIGEFRLIYDSRLGPARSEKRAAKKTASALKKATKRIL